MATTTTAAVAAPTTAGRGKLIIIVAAALVVVLLAGAAAYYFLFQRSDGHKAAPAAVAAPAPVFYPLEAFTVNLLSDDTGDRYLHLGLTLKVYNEKTKDALAEHLPELRSRILLLLTNKHAEDLSTLAGKQRLATEIRTLAAQTLGAEGNKVNEILFTDFVVQ